MAVILFTPIVANAAVATGITPDIQNNLAATGDQTGLGTQNPLVIAGKIIRIAIGLIGAIAISILIYAGYLYMTAGGDPKKIDDAKAWMKNAAIGLVIILASYSIATFIFDSLLGKNGGALEIAGTLPPGSYGLSSGAYGDIISSHFPTPEQTGVPRNTMILVTFKKSINPSSIIDESQRATVCPAGLDANIICGTLKPTVKLYRCADMSTFPAGQKLGTCQNVQVKDPTDVSKLVAAGTYVVMTEDHRTIVINPFGDSATHLGSSTESVSYIVHLSSGITKEGSATPVSVFPSSSPDGYKWRFTTSTLIDTTSPEVDSVVPINGAGIDLAVKDDSLCDVTRDVNCPVAKVYRNQMVIVNFNEAVIPPLIQTQNCSAGDSDNEVQVKVNNVPAVAPCATTNVPGDWKVGLNSYRTIQFTSGLACEGVDLNSCGEKVFCLPKDSNERIKILAARITGGISLFGTGIMDIAGNSLDGNANGKAEGPGTADETPLDNYISNFATGNAIDLVPPFIRNLNPANGTGGIDVNVPITATFNKNLDPYTVGTEISLVGQDFQGWYSAIFGKKVKLDSSGHPVLDRDGKALETADLRTVIIGHGPFQYVGPDEATDGPLYSPIISNGLKDSRQNCFTPARADSSASIDPTNPIPGATISAVGGDNDACSTAAIGSAPSNYGTSCCANPTTYKMEKKVGLGICPLPTVIGGTAPTTPTPPADDGAAPLDLPDFTFVGTITFPVLSPSNEVNVKVTVTNLGPNDSAFVKNGIKFSYLHADKSEASSYTTDLPNITNNVAQTVQVALPTDPTIKSVRVILDPSGTIAEADETNNELTVDIPANLAKADLPDLAFTPGDEIEIPAAANPRIAKAMYTNLGSVDSPWVATGVRFAFLDENKEVISVMMANLDSVTKNQGQVKFSQSSISSNPAIKFVQVTLDWNKVVAESDETNNVFERAVP